MTTAQSQTQEENAAGEPQAADSAAPASALEQELARMAEEVAKYKDQWVRSVAEMENLRKRTQRELEDNSRYAITGFAREMVDVLENLMRASQSIPSAARQESELVNTIGTGVDLTLQELQKTLERFGIQRIDPQGQKFDHNLHQAVVQLERGDVPDGTVVQVVQAGYVLHDRLLRPAIVAVSKWVESPGVDTTA